MSKAASGADVTFSIRWGSLPLVILDGFQTGDFKTNYTQLNRSRLGQQGQNVDQLFESVTGSVTVSVVTESWEAMKSAILASVLARGPSIGSVTKTTFYPETGRRTVQTVTGCTFDLSESVAAQAEQQGTVSFTSGTPPTTANF